MGILARWLRNGHVDYKFDSTESRTLLRTIFQHIPEFKAAEEDERYQRRLGPAKDPCNDYGE